MPENTTQKAVTLDALQAAAPLIATKAEVAKVKEQIQNIEAAGVTYATPEEVLALFKEPEPSGGETTGE